jgi:DNA-binding PadR family transcriptional regulator
MPKHGSTNPAPARLRLRHLQPLCLAILARKPGSGYDVRTALAAWPLFAGTPPDAPGIYRTLQGFAGRGLLRARKLPSAQGPPRVEYTLTSAGFEALASWQAALRTAHQELQAVMTLLQSAMRPTPKSPRPPPARKTAPPPRLVPKRKATPPAVKRRPAGRTP